MAVVNVKFSALPAVTTLADADVLPSVASSATSKITWANFKAALLAQLGLGTTGTPMASAGAVPTSYVVFSSTGTTTVPAWATVMRVYVVGGGGGGGSSDGSGGGGGGGGAALGFQSGQTVVPGQTVTVTIGTGGAVDADGVDSTVVCNSTTTTGAKGSKGLPNSGTTQGAGGAGGVGGGNGGAGGGSGAATTNGGGGGGGAGANTNGGAGNTNGTAGTKGTTTNSPSSGAGGTGAAAGVAVAPGAPGGGGAGASTTNPGTAGAQGYAWIGFGW